MSDYNKPIKEDQYEGILATIRDLFHATIRLLDSRDTDPVNKPERAKRWDNALARLQSWEGGQWLTKLLGVSGGGTGASTAEGARTNLGAASATDLSGHISSHPAPTNRDTRNEAAFTKNTAFNKNFGTAAGTVCQGNDSRLSNARTPTSHDNTYHSTNYEPAFTKNTAFNKNFGTATGTVCQGNDSRLSDSREWTGATVAQAEAEAGTATIRRAWTAQRVSQAITAAISSWVNISTSFAPGGDFTSGTIYASRVGNIVSLRWSYMGHAFSATPVGAAGVIPVAYRPAGDVANTYGMLGDRSVLITSTGNISFSYSNSGSVSWITTDVGCVSYPVN